MEIRYDKWYSPALGRDMEIKTYGRGGKPVLYIPCQDGRFYDFENFGMLDAWRPFLDAGQATVFSVDTIDSETWSNKSGNPYWRIRRHEDWMRYLTDEVVPFIRMICRDYGWKTNPGVMAFGASLGATHAANLYFRFPDMFDELLALSGIYDAVLRLRRLYGRQGLSQFAAALSAQHARSTTRIWSSTAATRRVICVGQGPWEMPDSTRALDHPEEKGIPAWVDLWGFDVTHDWPWWFKQVAYFRAQATLREIPGKNKPAAERRESP